MNALTTVAVRHRVKILFELLQDDEQLKAERKKAKLEGKEKYQGYSKDDIRMGMAGSAVAGGFG